MPKSDARTRRRATRARHPQPRSLPAPVGTRIHNLKPAWTTGPTGQAQRGGKPIAAWVRRRMYRPATRSAVVRLPPRTSISTVRNGDQRRRTERHPDSTPPVVALPSAERDSDTASGRGIHVTAGAPGRSGFPDEYFQPTSIAVAGFRCKVCVSPSCVPPQVGITPRVPPELRSWRGPPLLPAPHGRLCGCPRTRHPRSESGRQRILAGTPSTSARIARSCAVSRERLPAR
jgi:hypothetical protein